MLRRLTTHRQRLSRSHSSPLSASRLMSPWFALGGRCGQMRGAGHHVGHARKESVSSGPSRPLPWRRYRLMNLGNEIEYHPATCERRWSTGHLRRQAQAVCILIFGTTSTVWSGPRRAAREAPLELDACRIVAMLAGMLAEDEYQYLYLYFLILRARLCRTRTERPLIWRFRGWRTDLPGPGPTEREQGGCDRTSSGSRAGSS